MRYLVTGGGQIGSQLARDLTAAGHDVVLVRRSGGDIPSITTLRGDAGGAELLSRAMAGVRGVFHCIHAPYDATAWRRELPWREKHVMDAALDHGVPVVFPESVYAFGLQAESLHEGMEVNPCTPLGDVRAELLAARRAHPATTVSLVAGDLLGPTTGAGAVGTSTVVKPVRAGRRAWVLGNPDAPHSWTYAPDLSKAMVFAVQHVAELVFDADAVLHAPVNPPRSLRELATDVAAAAHTRARLTAVPGAVLRLTGSIHPTLRELTAQQYLWRRPAVMHSGVLTTRFGLDPTGWPDVIQSVAA